MADRVFVLTDGGTGNIAAMWRVHSSDELEAGNAITKPLPGQRLIELPQILIPSTPDVDIVDNYRFNTVSQRLERRRAP